MGDTPTPARRSRRRILVLVAATIVVLYLLLTALAVLYTESLWYREIGSSNVFRTMFWTRVGLTAVFGAVFAAFLAVNLWFVRRITPRDRASRVPEQILQRYRVTLRPFKRPALVGVGILAGLVAGLRASGMWREFLLWRHAGTFGTPDPVFGKDLGFFVFKLGFLRFVFGWTLSALVVTLILVTLAHYFRGGIRPQRKGERFAPPVRAHLSILAGLIVLLKAWGYRLDQFSLLQSNRGVVSGAGYTDVNARLPALWILFGLAILAGLVLLANARLRAWKLPLAAVGLLAGLSIVVGGLYPAVVQRLKVKPDERTLEVPYIKRNIDATRAAYKLNAIETTAYPQQTLTQQVLNAGVDAILNVRLWAPDVLQSVYMNLQREKQYYRFVSPADTDRYAAVTGSGRCLYICPRTTLQNEMMISAREISPNGLPPEAKTWVNTHLFYTHGYAVVASSADAIASQGRPLFTVRDIPPRGPIAISDPQLYFGENEEVPFIVVDTKQKELDYPTTSGSSVGYTTRRYDGRGGIVLDNFIKRSAFALRFRDLNLLISGSITDRSRLMFRRQILQRVRKAAPFLTIDSNPYIAVVGGGRLVWIVDGYTTSSRYPYSQPANFGAASNGLVSGSGNYMRDAVKFVVDAKNGTVDGYVWDDSDPILKAWIDIFPGIFKPRSSMPAVIASHVRYPEAFFGVQTDRFANYHVTDPGSFYQKEDAWLIARDPTYCLNNTGRCKGSTSAPSMPPYYMVTHLPNAPLRFVLVRPFTPGGSGRQSMVGYLVAHGDPEDYGRLVSYEFRSQQVSGPEQVQANINQDPAVSQQIALWNQQHSKVIYGNLLIVPVGDSLLYVQPLYLRGEGSQIPELKRVVVVGNGNVEMADTLDDALQQLLRDKPAPQSG